MDAPGDLAGISAEALRRRLLVYLWFDTAVPEELLPRSVLLAELRRHFRRPVQPVMLSMVVFVGWHRLTDCVLLLAGHPSGRWLTALFWTPHR